MAAVNSLLLLLTTIAPYADPPDPYTSPPFWNDTSPFDSDEYLEPCAPFLKPEGERGCPPNEHYERCGHVCMQSCIKYECPLRCCVEGCFCDEGLVRGIDGTCIREEECPPPVPRLFHETNRIDEPDSQPKECGADEYISCDSHCQRNCSNYHDVITCPKICVLDCVCIPPKIRGPQGNCILPHQCTPSSEYKREDLLICNYIRMMNPEDPRCSKTAMPCNNPFGCPDDVSEVDNVQDEIAKRVKLRTGNDERTPCFPSVDTMSRESCGPNEHYEECGAICMETCFEYECPLKCCVEGCFCNEGFVRDPSHHTCIPKQQCSTVRHLFSQHKGSEMEDPKRCRPGELLTCHSRCERTCDNYREENRKCPDECHMGCVCLPPKVRGPGGVCVYPKECPVSRETMLEEHMKIAAMICNFVRIMGNPPSWSDSCPMIVHDCTDPVECFEENSSPPLLGQFSVCRKNEYLNILPSCPVTCENYQNPSQECKVTDMVVPRCDCKQGLLRDSYGGCVPPENCPSKDGYECSDPNGCPSIEETSSPFLQGQFLICRKNEYLNVLPSCPITCDNYQNPSQECKVTDMVVPRCDCKQGLVRDSYGGCVPPENCPSKEAYECTDPNGCPSIDEKPSPPLQGQFSICRKNEYLNILPSCPITCDNYRNPAPGDCKITDMVVPRCDCKEGLVRNSFGGCVPPENCPSKEDPKKCPEHEAWQTCGTACPKTCQNYDANVTCTDQCKEGCFCKEPRVRGPDEKCVLKEECPPKSVVSAVCPENEYYDSCLGHCQKDCDNYGRNLTCPKCVPGCVCVPPMVRGPDCRCIHPDRCPTEKKEMLPARFVNGSLFVPDNCKFDTKHNGSICQNRDYWKNIASHSCLEKEMRLNNFSMLLPCGVDLFAGVQFVCCPMNDPKKCPEHEEWQTCGTACPKTCQNYDANVNCTDQRKKGCFCKEPRVRGPDEKCILKEECPPKSAEMLSARFVSEFFLVPDKCQFAHEHNGSICQSRDYWKNIASRSCLEKEMRLNNFSMLLPCGVDLFAGVQFVCCPMNGPPCPQILCRKGYFLDARAKPCPKCIECPLVNCLRGCRLDTTQEPCPTCVCDQKSKDHSCPDMECDKGWYLDFSNTPCPECQACPQIKCRSGCYYDSENKPCPRCICHNQEAHSAPPSECPKNEYWNECGSFCPKTCSNRDKGGRFCPAVCVKGCFCKSPLVRGPFGKCIPVRDCP